MNNTAKKCTECGKLLTLDSFRLVNTSKDGHAHICKDCSRLKRASKKMEKSVMSSTGGGNSELAKFTPRELIAELRSRGFTGKLSVIREIIV